MYCIEESMPHGDWIDTVFDYGRVYETLEECQSWCDYFNKVNHHDYIHPHLMTETEVKEYKEEQEFWDNLY